MYPTALNIPLLVALIGMASLNEIQMVFATVLISSVGLRVFIPSRSLSLNEFTFWVN